MSGLSVGTFGPLGGLGDTRGAGESLDWAAERWTAANCASKGTAYTRNSGCNFHAAMAVTAGQQMALIQLGVKKVSVADAERAVITGKSLSGFSASQIARALAAGQSTVMNTLGIPTPPKTIPRPPASGSLAEGVMLLSLEQRIAELRAARGAPTVTDPSMLTPEQQTLLSRMTAQEKAEVARAASLSRVRAAQDRQRNLRAAQTALAPPGARGIPPLRMASVEPWKATGILLLGAGLVGTIIYSFGRGR